MCFGRVREFLTQVRPVLKGVPVARHEGAVVSDDVSERSNMGSLHPHGHDRINLRSAPRRQVAGCDGNREEENCCRLQRCSPCGPSLIRSRRASDTGSALASSRRNGWPPTTRCSGSAKTI